MRRDHGHMWNLQALLLPYPPCPKRQPHQGNCRECPPKPRPPARDFHGRLDVAQDVGIRAAAGDGFGYVRHPLNLLRSRVSKNRARAIEYGWSVRNWIASMPAERNRRAVSL